MLKKNVTDEEKWREGLQPVRKHYRRIIAVEEDRMYISTSQFSIPR